MGAMASKIEAASLDSRSFEDGSRYPFILGFIVSDTTGIIVVRLVAHLDSAIRTEELEWK